MTKRSVKSSAGSAGSVSSAGLLNEWSGLVFLSDLFILGVLVFGLSCPSSAYAQSTEAVRSTEVATTESVVEPEVVRPTETIALFNGKDLTGWYTYIQDQGKNVDPKGVFTVRDGLLRISGEQMGCITTDKAYADYILTVECKWGGKTWAPREFNTRDSGILVHSQGKDGAWGKTWLYSIECNIIEGGMGDFIVVGNNTPEFQITSNIEAELSNGCGVWKEDGTPKQLTAGRINWYGRDPKWTDTIGFVGDKDLNKPGEWVTIQVIVNGDTITNIVNGVVVNKAYNVKPSCGKIQIQSELAEILFRKITLEPVK